MNNVVGRLRLVLGVVKESSASACKEASSVCHRNNSRESTHPGRHQESMRWGLRIAKWRHRGKGSFRDKQKCSCSNHQPCTRKGMSVPFDMEEQRHDVTYCSFATVALAGWSFALTGIRTSSSVIGTSRPWSLNKFMAAGMSLGVDPPMKWDSRPDREDCQIPQLPEPRYVRTDAVQRSALSEQLSSDFRHRLALRVHGLDVVFVDAQLHLRCDFVSVSELDKPWFRLSAEALLALKKILTAVSM